MSNQQKKTILVIGAGASGLPAIKCCLEENLNVVCCELSDDIGGLWRYRPEVVEGQGSVMRSTVINSSKEMGAYSDFPPPDHFPNFMHNSWMMEYLRMYADRFQLLQHIRFKHQVVSVTKRDDFAQYGQWNATVRDLRFIKGDVEEELVVDGVMICTGHHAIPRMVDFPGIETFQGSVMHSHSYRTPDGFDGKRVLVIGIGNSGVDVATEVGTVAKQVYLSTRSGSWVTPRVIAFGQPVDCFMVTRFLQKLISMFPTSFSSTFVEAIVNLSFHHGVHDSLPKHRFLNQHPTISEILSTRLNTGAVVLKGNVRRFTNSGVVFEGDDQSEHEIDVVVMCTGFKGGKPPFIADGLVSVNGDNYDLYKLMLSPGLEKQTLAFIGLPQPLGSIMPVSEMQSRWFLQALTNQMKLPGKKEMWEEVRNRAKRTAAQFYSSPRHKTEIFFVEYMDNLAHDFGVMPDLKKMIFNDFRLFWVCFFGPGCLSYQYRLRGPHSAPKESRRYMLTAKKRMQRPLQTRTGSSKSVGKDTIFSLTYWINLFVLIVAYLFSFRSVRSKNV